MNNLSNSERETHLNLVADERGTWHVFSDDPVMIRRQYRCLASAADLPLGIDRGTATIANRLAGELGESIDLIEPEPDR